jgi:hypothetical protein
MRSEKGSGFIARVEKKAFSCWHEQFSLRAQEDGVFSLKKIQGAGHDLRREQNIGFC